MWFPGAIAWFLLPTITFCNYLLSFWACERLLLALIWIKVRFHYSKERDQKQRLYSEENFIASQEWPPVTIQLPVFNEREVVERLIHCISKIDYPLNKLQVQVLDDSTDDTTDIIRSVLETLPKNYPIVLVHRTVRTGFKAGAMAEAMKDATGEFIVVFDADFLPEPDFVKRVVVPFFSDPKIGVVQGRWDFLNENDSILTKYQSITTINHFQFEQFVRSYGGLFLTFNGTAGAWRKACIEDGGGWHGDTLAEDLDLSFRVQMKGWRILYMEDLPVPSELPTTMEAYKHQQYRWVKGGMQCFKKHFLTVLFAPMSLYTKFFALVHLSRYMSYVWIFFLAFLPVFAMPFSPTSIWTFFLVSGFAGTIVPLILSQWSLGKYRNIMYIPFVLSFAYGMYVNGLIAMADGFFFKTGTFVRTPKQGGTGQKAVKAAQKQYYPVKECVMLGVSLYAIFYGNIANQGFFVTHFWYGSCHLLVLYFTFAMKDEDPSDLGDSNGSHEHVRKVSAVKSGIKFAQSTVLKVVFLVFWMLMINQVASRFPPLSDRNSWSILLGTDVPKPPVSPCLHGEPSFSSWHDEFVTLDCPNVTRMYKVEGHFDFVRYYGPFLPEDEYIFTRCGDKVELLLRNKPNSRLLQRAKKDSDAPNVVVFLLDGKTVVSLSELPKSGAAMIDMTAQNNGRFFDYKNYLPASFYDGNHEISLLSGCGIHTAAKESYGFRYDPKEDGKDFFTYYKSGEASMLCHIENKTSTEMKDAIKQHLWLWNHFQQAGYVTHSSINECFRKSSSAKFFTRKGGLPNDHSFGDFYCDRFFDSHCFNDVQLNQYALNYLEEFWNNYNNAPKFSLIHLKSNSIENVDETLSTFLNKFSKEATNTVIFLAGNPKLPKTEELKKVPPHSLLSVYVPRAALTSNIETTLDQNQNKLISSFDLYHSLARASYSWTKKDPATTIESVIPPWSIDIFKNPVPESRSCASTRVATKFCVPLPAPTPLQV